MITALGKAIVLLTLKPFIPMKQFFRFFACLALTAAAVAGCSDDNTSPAPGHGNFKLSVTGITTTSCTISVTPKNAEATYIAMLVEKSEFDAFANDAAVIAGDLEDFRAEAEYYGSTLAEHLRTYYLRRGTVAVDIEDELEPGVKYYLYAYGMDENGTATTGIEKIEFAAASVPLVDATFDIRLDELTSASCRMTVDVQPASTHYFYNIIDEAAYIEFGGNDEAFARHMKARMVDVYLDMGRSIEDIYKYMSSTGTDSEVFPGLRAGKKYYAFAVGVNELFQANTEVAVKEFNAPAVEASSNTFTLDITPTYDGIEGTITTSNDDPYIYYLLDKNFIDYYTDPTKSDAENDESLMYEIVTMLTDFGLTDRYLRTGTTQVKETGYEQDTDYCLLVFGWNEAPTTALTRLSVHTDAGEADPSKLVVDFEITDETYNGATVHLIPNCGVTYFYDKIEAEYYDRLVAEEGGTDKAVIRLVNESIEFFMDYYGYENKADAAAECASIGEEFFTFNDLEPETDYVVFAASLDTATGEVAYPKGFVSRVFTTGKLIISDAFAAFEPGKYYDGDAIADLDPKYESMRGNAVLTYTVKPNAAAAEWYTNFYQSAGYADCDIEFAKMILVEYGYDMGNPDNVSKNLTDGIRILPWNQDYTFLAIAKDAEGYFGNCEARVVNLSKEGASPAQEFVDANR